MAQAAGKPPRQHRSTGATGIGTKDNLRAWKALEKITDCLAQVLHRLTSGEPEEHDYHPDEMSPDKSQHGLPPQITFYHKQLAKTCELR
jgi:hypothetical protein